MQVEVSIVDEPQLLTFRGTYKLASEPRGTARSAALAAAETVLVSAPDSTGALEYIAICASCVSAESIQSLIPQPYSAQLFRLVLNPCTWGLPGIKNNDSKKGAARKVRPGSGCWLRPAPV